MTTRRVFIQQNCVPHYRTPLFELLSSDSRLICTVFAGEQADGPFLAVATPESTRIRWHVAPVHTIALPAGVRLFWQPRVLIRMLRERPDAVIAQGSPYVLTAWALLLLGQLIRVPVLLWTHGLRGDESGPKWLIRKVLYHLAAGLLLYGDHAKALLVAKGFIADRLDVIYNSLDVAEQEAVLRTITEQDREAFRHSLGIEAEEGLICFTGRLQPVKRLPWLLQALYLLKQRRMRVHLALVGEGSERAKLEALSTELELTALVHFLGSVYDERQLGLVISASDLAVIPSGAGLSVMHALAYGTPVLLHDRAEDHFPEWEAVKEGETGWFYRYGDLTDCADKIMEALRPQPKKHLMAQACRSIIDSRYNTATQTRLFIEAVAKYCPRGQPGKNGGQTLREQSYQPGRWEVQ